MKNLNLLYGLACSLLVSACSSSEDLIPELSPDDSVVPNDIRVSFDASISSVSRASDTQFDNGDKIGVFAVEAGSSDGYIQTSGNYASNVLYTYNGSRFTSASEIKIPDDGTKYYYHAIYPYISSANASFRFSVKSDQRGSDYTLSDLCTAHTSATSEELVHLKFAHRYSKIVIKLIGDNWPVYSDAMFSINSVRVGATVDLNAMKISTMPTYSRVICAENGTKSFKAIVPPQVLKKTDTFANLIIGGKSYPCNLGADRMLNPGKQLVIEYELTPSGKLVEFTGDINPWEEDDERIDRVLPPEIRDKIKDYIPIYVGPNPPVIEGTYFMDPNSTVYCDDGYFKPGQVISSYYYKFYNQDRRTNTLDYNSVSEGGTAKEVATGAIISGQGNDFTALFSTSGVSQGVNIKTVTVISGTKTSSGIRNMRKAFILVDKGPDPYGKIMDVGGFRVFEDKDGLAKNSSWPGRALATCSLPLMTSAD